MNIILASASPRRRELLKLITEDFTAVSTDADETLPPDVVLQCQTTPETAAVYLSEIKAQAVAEDYSDSIVIGCDTVVIVDKTILGKPHDEQECREYLRMLSGRSHQVTTGCTIICGNEKKCFNVNTEVRFRSLTDEDIEWYISTGEPFDKAGGYGIQGKGSLLIESINGDYFNVVGLPVSELNYYLKEFLK